MIGYVPAGGLVAGLRQEFGGTVDARLDADVHGGLPGEAGPFPDRDVVGEDDGVGGGDGLGGELGEAGGALGLDLDLDPGFGGGLLEGLGGHVGVRDARGAGGDGDDPERLPFGGSAPGAPLL